MGHAYERPVLWKSVLACVALLAVLVVGAVWTILNALDRPVVYESIRTGRCVRVEVWREEDRGYSCSRLPPRYEHVLVR